jgi:hypothetical protein
MNPLQERRLRVTVRVNRINASGEEQDYTYTFVQHRISVSVSQGGKQFGNARVEIFGIKLDTMNQVARLWLESLTPRVTDVMEIDVWDGKEFIPFFSGVITWSAINATRQPAVSLEIEANDAMALMLTVAPPYAQEGPVLLQDALEAVLGPAGYVVDISDTVLPNDISRVRVEGTALEQAGAIMAQFPDLTWFTNLQRFVVRNANQPFESDPVLVAVETGMIGYPAYSTSGLSISTLFNPRIRPGVALDVLTYFDFVNRTRWVSAVLQHTLEANTPGGAWMTQIAAQSFGTKGNQDGNAQ